MPSSPSPSPRCSPRPTPRDCRPTGALAGRDEPLLPMPMVNVDLRRRARTGRGGRRAGRPGRPDRRRELRRGDRVGLARATGDRARWRREHGYASSLVADEGGLGLPLPSNRDALELVLAGIERAGLSPGEQAAIAVDVAATQLLVAGGYRLAADGPHARRSRPDRRARGVVRRFPGRLARGSPGRGRLDGLERGDPAARDARPARRRRPVRHPDGAAAPRAPRPASPTPCW